MNETIVGGKGGEKEEIIKKLMSSAEEQVHVWVSSDGILFKDEQKKFSKFLLLNFFQNFLRLVSFLKILNCHFVLSTRESHNELTMFVLTTSASHVSQFLISFRSMFHSLLLLSSSLKALSSVRNISSTTPVACSDD
jgi:hypothetical protein